MFGVVSARVVVRRGYLTLPAAYTTSLRSLPSPLLLPLRRSNSTKTTHPPPQQQQQQQPHSSQYVHPLSQAVLSHLQDSSSGFLSDWSITELRIRDDGTFRLRSSAPSGAAGEGGRGGGGVDITTVYDGVENRHFLKALVDGEEGIFLLMDNTKPAWQMGREGGIADRVKMAVDDMVKRVEEVKGRERN